MDELPKIELESSLKKSASTATMGKQSKKFPRFLKILIGALLVIVVFGIVLFFVVFLPGKKVYASALKTYQQAKTAYAAVKKQNVQLASEELAKTKSELEKTQKDLQTLSFVRVIPFVGNYFDDANHLIKAGFYGIDAATILVDSVKPYADILGLKGQGSFVMGSAEQRVQTAVLTMGKITPRIDDISEALNKARDEIDKIDPNRYPSSVAGKDIKGKLLQLRTLTDQGVELVDEARPLIKVLPSLLGESKERKYLVLFQNDKELRPTGGFITAYAIFRVDKGIIRIERSDDLYNLDNSLRKKFPAPRPIKTYLPKITTFNLRDANLSPDFVVSMDTFNDMYEFVSGRVDVDGIIALDTHVLVSTIKILDDEVQVGGLKFTTKEDKRCDCPQVIYELEDQISRPVNYLKGGGRKDLLGALLYAIMEKALRSSPKLYWGPLLQDMLAKTNEKHVLFYLEDKQAQKGIEALNAAGRIKSFDGDYLHINQANFGGAKSNLFVKESVAQEIKVESDGAVVETVTINYKNPHQPSDCNLERGGLCLNATLRDWLRLYVPKGSTLVDSKGSEVKLITYDELGKTVFEGFLTVRPEGAAVFTISYRLPFKLKSGSPLPLLIQKQPGTNDNEYTIKLNGRQVEKFALLTDKEFKLKK